MVFSRFAARAHARAHTRARARTHTHTHTRARARARTLSLSLHHSLTHSLNHSLTHSLSFFLYPSLAFSRNSAIQIYRGNRNARLLIFSVSMSSFSSPLRYRVPRLPRLSSRFTIDLLRSLVSKGIMPNKKKEEERKKRKGRNRFGANRLAREKITKRVYHPGRNPIKKARVCLVAREGFKDEGCVNE